MSKIRFDTAFKHLTDNPPFPWQQELFNCLKRGNIERSIDIPTGLGKTAVMAIWLIAQAVGASLPRRLAYIVDRRAVVDQATEIAVEIRKAVDSNAALKQALKLGDRSLPISTLRGQHIDNKEWLEDPSSTAIIVGTIDMIGSRLLFEGYGTSRKMRPYHAGLLGADTLVILDEAHLVPPFEMLLDAIANERTAFGPRDEKLRAIIPEFKLMSLSATGRSRRDKPITLTPKDLKHPVVKKRLNAKKRLTLVPLKEQMELSEALANHAWKLSEKGKLPVRIIIFFDKRENAEKAKKALERLAKEASQTAIKERTELFIGGRRVYERQIAAQRLRELGFLAGSKVKPSQSTYVFATSAGEVGVDLDADHMVCDLVAWERMVQRLGRVNRRGDGNARVIVVVEPDPKPSNPQKLALEKDAAERSEKETKHVEDYQSEIARARAKQKPFKYLRRSKDGKTDASPGAIRELKKKAEKEKRIQAILDAATTPEPLRPALTRALVDAWSMTSLKEHTGRPDIEPWLRGWKENDPQTSIVWRKYLPTRPRGQLVPTKKEIEAFFEAAPPHASEVLETETFRVLNWLTSRVKTMAIELTKPTEVHNALTPTFGTSDVIAILLSSAGDKRKTLTFSDCLFDEDDSTTEKDSKKANKERKEELGRMLSNSTLIVDARCGGLSSDGLLNDSEETIPSTADDGVDNEWQMIVRFRVRSINAEAEGKSVDQRQWRQRLRFPTVLSDDDEQKSWFVVEKWRGDSSTEEDRAIGNLQLLNEHQKRAEKYARDLAASLGINGQYAEMLCIAARLHDEGKRAKRWQRAFNAPGNVDDEYAKTPGPVNVALLDGYRHEFSSLAVASTDRELSALPPELKDLALHLIAAHHGFARPIIRTSGCDDAPPSQLEERARDVAMRFTRLQRSWGPWGLAWWESLLRAADQLASRANDVTDDGEVV